MKYQDQVGAFIPQTEQERNDREIMLELIRRYPETILLRENKFAHFTSSGLILNRERNKVLFVHHNIYKTWSWTGGHADGDGDLLRVAVKEAGEETGLAHVEPLDGKIVSLDILPVFGHIKNGRYVSAHLHLNASYLLLADEHDAVRACENENSGVRWFGFDELEACSSEPYLIAVYRKMLGRMPG